MSVSFGVDTELDYEKFVNFLLSLVERKRDSVYFEIQSFCPVSCLKKGNRAKKIKY